MTTQEPVKLPDCVKCRMCGSQMYAEGINLVCENNHHFNPQTHFYKHVVLDVLGFKKLAEEVYYSSRARRNLKRRVIASEVVKYLFKDGIFTYDQLPTCEICRKRKCSFNGSISPYTKHPKYQYVSSVCPNRQCVSKKTASTDANIMRRPEGVQKLKEALMAKYGVENISSLESVKRKKSEIQKRIRSDYEFTVKVRLSSLKEAGVLQKQHENKVSSRKMVQDLLDKGLTYEDIARYDEWLYNFWRAPERPVALHEKVDFKKFSRAGTAFRGTGERLEFICRTCGHVIRKWSEGRQFKYFYALRMGYLRDIDIISCPKCHGKLHARKSRDSFEFFVSLIDHCNTTEFEFFKFVYDDNKRAFEYDLFMQNYNIYVEYDGLIWHTTEHIVRLVEPTKQEEEFEKYVQRVVRKLSWEREHDINVLRIWDFQARAKFLPSFIASIFKNSYSATPKFSVFQPISFPSDVVWLNYRFEDDLKRHTLYELRDSAGAVYFLVDEKNKRIMNIGILGEYITVDVLKHAILHLYRENKVNEALVDYRWKPLVMFLEFPVKTLTQINTYKYYYNRRKGLILGEICETSINNHPLLIHEGTYVLEI